MGAASRRPSHLQMIYAPRDMVHITFVGTPGTVAASCVNGALVSIPRRKRTPGLPLGSSWKLWRSKRGRATLPQTPCTLQLLSASVRTPTITPRSEPHQVPAWAQGARGAVVGALGIRGSLRLCATGLLTRTRTYLLLSGVELRANRLPQPSTDNRMLILMLLVLVLVLWRCR